GIEGEARRHFGARTAVADDAAVRAAAEHEHERIDQNGLTGAGLASEHGQARGGLEIERADDGEIANMERCEHARCSWSARVRRAVKALPVASKARSRVVRWRTASSVLRSPAELLAQHVVVI